MKTLLYLFCFTFINYLTAQQTVGLFQNDSLSLNGYTLISSLSSTETYLVDNCGEVVNKWSNSAYKPGPVLYLLNDGSLLKTCKLTSGSMIAGGSGGRIERYDWNDSLIWEYDFDSPIERQHHDIFPMANGNILVLSWDLKTRIESITAGLDTTLHNLEVWSEKIVEITPIGQDSAAIVWEWFLWDHLVQDFNPNSNNFGNISTNKQLVDLNYINNNGRSRDFFHANGIDYNATLDQIIISVRNYDEFWIIDHSTTTAQAATSSGGLTGMGGDLLYRWGNPETYQQGSIVDKKLFGQHNPNWIPSGFRDQGKIMVFNNGFNAPTQISKVEIINPPILSNGTYATNSMGSYLPDTAEWSYDLPVFVDFVSGAQRLENGNTFITSGPDGHLYELDNNDSIVWEYINPLQANGTTVQGVTPAGNTMFRSYRYSENYSAFSGRNLIRRGPLELNPLPSNCILYPSGATSINETLFSDKKSIKLYPNPVENNFTIEVDPNVYTSIKVINIQGQVVWENMKPTSKTIISAEQWNPGTYVLIVQTKNNISTQKFIKL